MRVGVWGGCWPPEAPGNIVNTINKSSKMLKKKKQNMRKKKKNNKKKKRRGRKNNTKNKSKAALHAYTHDRCKWLCNAVTLAVPSCSVACVGKLVVGDKISTCVLRCACIGLVA